MLKNKRGFTLVEVIVVLIILAILAAIMIPSMTGWVETAKARSCLHNLGLLRRDYMTFVAYNKYEVSDPEPLLKEAVAETNAGTGVSGNTYTGSCGGTITVTYGGTDGKDYNTIKEIECSLH